eukprot:4447573-Ditylum_brightwellii.AAC.1
MIHDADEGTLFQQQNNNKQLYKALDNVHKGVLTDIWTNQTFTAYIKANGINEKTIAPAYKHTENCRMIDVYGHTVETNDDAQFILQDASANLEMYQKMPYPPTWDD